MRKVNKTLFIVFCVFYFFEKVSCAYAATAQITIHVTGEAGDSISGAEVTYGFTATKTSGWGVNSIGVEGKTDEKGFVTAKHETDPYVTIHVEKGGYYHSGTIFEAFTGRSIINHWEPWNPTLEVVLKKKRNPVPMYDSHRTSYKVPELTTPIGFDLEKEDWVAPYGGGMISDFIIKFNVMDRAYTDYECGFTLTFSNPNDGIQEYFFKSNDPSYFKWPFEAPVSGYHTEISKQKTMSPTKGYRSDEKNNVNYLFRVRTKVDQNGNIIEAKYGKLIGEFGYVPNGQISFRYILNPDGTRNLEEDPEKNLFKKK